VREVRVVEYPMSIQVKKVHPALKHAGYAATALLPGENPADFEKLHRDLIAELKPDGPLEDDIVATIARLVWRKQNLATFRIAERARNVCEKFISERLPDPFSSLAVIDPAVREEATWAAHDQARKELEDVYALVEVGDAATVDRLLGDLEVEERLDARIDKCVKRLLVLRGLKSISTAYPSAPPRRIPGPPRRSGLAERSIAGSAAGSPGLSGRQLGRVLLQT
jgi:hypothetical protein